MFSLSSRGRLTVRDLDRFRSETLFDRLARTICEAGCLPRKELYEAWEVARRVRRRFRGGRVVDLGGGHGLLAHVLLLLDASSPSAIIVDNALPPSSSALHEALARRWPQLSGRIEFRSASLDGVAILPGDAVVSSHACGALTDRVLDVAVSARARVAVLPCCHELGAAEHANVRALSAWVDGGLAIDIGRALRLQRAGYRVWTQTIPAQITPKNRLLIGEPNSIVGP